MKSTAIKTLLHAVLIFIALLSPGAQAGVEITFIHNDALGTPIAGTDEQGNVKWRAHYQPYGEELLGERQLFGVRTGYTGHRDDPETGLTYMGARYYSPVLGRFMGVDPAGVDASNIHSFNRYAYANNNPYKYVDPNGEFAILPFLLPVAETALVYTGEAILGVLVGVGLVEGVNAVLNENTEEDGSNDNPTDRDVSQIEDITEPGARTPNIRTDVPRSEFEDNLLDSGFTKGTSKDQKVNIFTKGDKKFTTRDFSNSTNGPTADVFKNGDPKSKIRLGD